MPLTDIQVVYPTEYDSAATIMGIAENRQTFTLNGGLSVSSTSLVVDGTAGGDDYDLTDLDLPCLLVFAGGEIWYIEDGDVLSATTLTINFSQRAQMGTSPQIHADDEKVHSYFSGIQHEMLRDILINMEKFPVVQGEQPSTPTVVGEAYIDSNYDIYVSFDGASFTKLVSGHHDNLSDIPTGASTTVHGDQYMHGENTTFTDWHDTQAGVQIDSGDDHAHLVDGTDGEAVERIAYGSALPTGEKIGQIFLKDGELFFIYDSGLAFEEFFGIPSGSILPFPPASGCPSGWSAYSALNSDAYARVKTGGIATTGGANTHTHTVSEIEAHTHTILEDTCTSSTDGDHSHYFRVADSGAGGGIQSVLSPWGFASGTTLSPSVSHSHTGGTQAAETTNGVTADAMEASFVTDSDSTEPAYKTMKWCKKD